jgi:UDP-N-acetylglucosamine--N-acetylmuramyl-(pentapeptide) pyrophosphoryl-undecaprenol N-acetylglucosamine transferase
MIAAGGTGGHVFPGVAIAEALVQILPEAEVFFAGTSNGPEAHLVPAEGWPLVTIGTASIHSGGLKNKLKAYAHAVRTMFLAWKALSEHRPDVVIGIGGFAAGPLLLLAALRRIPTAIVEPNAIAGRTNRILGYFVHRVFVGFKSTATSFSARKVVVTGNPVRSDVAKVVHSVYNGTKSFTVLCYGGSQGARHLNEVMLDAMNRLKNYADKVRIIHQVGKANPVEEIAHEYRRAGFEAEVFTFSHKMADFYREADMAIARSGAGTVAELAAVRLPAMLVPYPHAADDHQFANAEELVRAGGAVVVKDSDLDGEDLAKKIVDFMEHPWKLKEMREALAKVGRPDAADVIAKECINMARVRKEDSHV